jgi:predicted ester cyclase
MSEEQLQKNKECVWELWQLIRGENAVHIRERIKPFIDEDISWQGPHPINLLKGVDELREHFWQPLFHSFPDIRKEPYIFFGGEYQDTQWITGTGHYRGTFLNDWLGIPATREETTIRFGEFCQMKDGKIRSVYIIFDIPDVTRQAGCDMFPAPLAQSGFVPGPREGDGILLDPQDESESAKSLTLVEAMLAGLADYDQSGTFTCMGQDRYWDKEGMLWYGPHGIGTTYGLSGFETYHQRPFLHAFPDRKGGNHTARFAEGRYAASTGWPSLRATHTGEYLGVPGTGKKIEMRVIDYWKREGELLTENWVFIDMIDLFRQMGVDLFERMNSKLDV